MIERIQKLRDILKDNACAIIESDSSRRYITGFPSSAGIVVITLKRAILLIDFRYFEKASKVVKHMDVVLLTNTYEQIKKILSDESIYEVYIETEKTSVRKLSEYTRQGINISESDELDVALNELRSVKSECEIRCIKIAQEYTDATFSYIIDRIKVGMSERDIMLDMEFYMRKLGSEGVAFDFIVVSGKNSSLPHGVPSEKLIESGDFITMDFGAVYNGYHSDMTRTVAVGKVTPEQERVYNIVLDAQLEAMKNIKPDVECCAVDKVARDIIYNSGFEGYFGHGLGHSVGLDIHENPSFNTRCKTVLKPGMVMSVEPGIYIPDSFGVRIEDLIAVTDDGYENLTHSPKELLIIN